MTTPEVAPAIAGSNLDDTTLPERREAAPASGPATGSSPSRSAAKAGKHDALVLLDAVVASMGGTRRAGQHEMAEEVERTIDQGGTVLVQAGTGTGKSLGYLVPALAHAVRAGERVVVSTATLALQRQLVARDLPTVVAALAQIPEGLPRPASFAVLKGWQNYACRHKLAGGYPPQDAADLLFDLDGAEHPAPSATGAAGSGSGARQESAQASALAEHVLRLRAWAEETTTGDRDELDPGVSDRAWRQVSVTTQECLGGKCPMLSSCFPEAARNRARAADLVVTNHAMLGIAAAGNTGLLPEHDVVIVDEAHELANRVTSAASVELTVRAVEQAARLARRQGADDVGALTEAAARLAAVLVPLQAGRFTLALPEALAVAVASVRDAARTLTSVLKPGQGSSGKGGAPDDPGAKVAQAAMTALFDVCERIVAQDVERDVIWARRAESESSASILAAPLDVAGLVHEGILGVRSAVLTSATLALGGRFDVAARSVGLFGAAATSHDAAPVASTREPGAAADRWHGVSVQSPFDYARQAILYTARHLPRPGRDGAAPEHIDELAELVEAARGRTLGLFSSRRAATAAAEALRARLDVPVLCQGDDQLPVLVRRFLEEPETCLFGSLSLWQGVDVPGDSCRLVVIDRIPFPRPDDPVIAARSERADSRGGNGFMEVSAAHAALLLAQGAGRLVRSVDDRGVVAVLDPRLETAGYARFLKASLPAFWPTTDPAVARSALRRLAAG